LSIKDKISVDMLSFRFFILFLNVFIIKARYMADIIGDRDEPCLMPTFVEIF